MLLRRRLAVLVATASIGVMLLLASRSCAAGLLMYKQSFFVEHCT